jgi:hypothetical protein
VKRHDILCLARSAVQIARTQIPDYASKFAPKRFTQPSLLACLCLKEFLHMDYRSCEALLASAQELRTALGWHAVPDHSILWWCSRHQAKPRLLARALSETVRLFQRAAAPRYRPVAVDSTGFARAPASPYYQPRADHRHRARTWLKWSVAVWTDPLVLCGQIADRGPGGDHVEFRPLVAQTLARLRFTRLLADGGYASETNPPLVAGRPGHREHYSACRGTTSAWPDVAPRSPPAPTGLSPEDLGPAVESRDVHLGRQGSVWQGGHGAPYWQ